MYKLIKATPLQSNVVATGNTAAQEAIPVKHDSSTTCLEFISCYHCLQNGFCVSLDFAIFQSIGDCCCGVLKCLMVD